MSRNLKKSLGILIKAAIARNTAGKNEWGLFLVGHLFFFSFCFFMKKEKTDF
jgi:hypothetical protein